MREAANCLDVCTVYSPNTFEPDQTLPQGRFATTLTPNSQKPSCQAFAHLVNCKQYSPTITKPAMCSLPYGPYSFMGSILALVQHGPALDVPVSHLSYPLQLQSDNKLPTFCCNPTMVPICGCFTLAKMKAKKGEAKKCNQHTTNIKGLQFSKAAFNGGPHMAGNKPINGSPEPLTPRGRIRTSSSSFDENKETHICFPILFYRQNFTKPTVGCGGAPAETDT
jgi:hypothetical protein